MLFSLGSSQLLTLYMSPLKLGQNLRRVQTLPLQFMLLYISIWFCMSNSLLAIYLLQEVKYYTSICIWLTVPDCLDERLIEFEAQAHIRPKNIFVLKGLFKTP